MPYMYVCLRVWFAWWSSCCGRLSHALPICQCQHLRVSLLDFLLTIAADVTATGIETTAFDEPAKGT